jgi:hypothetical protein
MLLIQQLLHELITHFVRELVEEERSYLESEAKSLFHMAKGEQEGQHQVEVVEAAACSSLEVVEEEGEPSQ